MGVAIGAAGARVAHLLLHVNAWCALRAAILGRRVVTEPLSAADTSATGHATFRPVCPVSETTVHWMGEGRGRSGREGESGLKAMSESF